MNPKHDQTSLVDGGVGQVYCVLLLCHIMVLYVLCLSVSFLISCSFCFCYFYLIIVIILVVTLSLRTPLHLKLNCPK